MTTTINQDKLNTELLFHAFAMYMADDKIKNKVYLTDPEVLDEIVSVDDIIKEYAKKKKLTIKYIKELDDEYVGIFKNKKLIVALDVDKFI